MGRSRGKTTHKPDRRRSYSQQVNFGLISSQAFIDLTGAAKSICVMCFIESDRAGFRGEKNEKDRPYFKWSAIDSGKHLGISGRNHFKAIDQLKQHGFIEVEKAGGLKGANGTANHFVLLGEWQRWEPPTRKVSTKQLVVLAKGRATALKNRNKKNIDATTEVELEEKTVNVNSLVIASEPANVSTRVSRGKPRNMRSLVESHSDVPYQAGQAVYYKRPDDRRALKAELIEQQGACWLVKGARTATKITRPTFVIRTQYIMSIDQVKNAK